MRWVLVGILALAACGKDAPNLTDGGGSNGSGCAAITTCSNDDRCCAAGCNSDNDNDCVPATAPLGDRLVVSTITTPAGVIPGDSVWRIWGTGSLKVGPVYTVPFADCGTLVGYTTGSTSSPRARVARIDAMDHLVTTYDLGAFTLRGLAAEADGHWAALLWDQAPNPKSLHVTRYAANGTPGWTTSLDNALAAPTDFGIGESRLEFRRRQVRRVLPRPRHLRLRERSRRRRAALARRHDRRRRARLGLGMLALDERAASLLVHRERDPAGLRDRLLSRHVRL
jgi:hypothetical protein